MAIKIIFCRLSLHQLLEILEEDEDGEQPTNIYIVPPDEKSEETEEDSDNSDEETANPSRISRGILNQLCEARYENSDFEDEEDNIPLSILKNDIFIENKNNRELDIATSIRDDLDESPNLGIPRRKRAKNSSKWSTNIPTTNIDQDCISRQPSAEAFLSETPLDFLNLYWNENIISHIVTQSNIYAQQKNLTLNLTTDELYVIFGAMLLSGYSKCPNKRMYWSSADDVPKLLYNSIRLNRFETILRNLHF